MTLLLVLLGGAVGAAVRHGVAQALPGRRATLLVNLAGSLLLGVLVGVLLAALVLVVVLVAVPDRGTSSAAATTAQGSGTSTSAPADDTDGNRTSAATSAATSAPRTSAVPTPTVSPEDEALEQLDSLRAASVGTLRLDDRWVAQVASKSVGITDPLQVAANGRHTLHPADIPAGIQQAQSRAGGQRLLVVQSTDFGKRSYGPNGQPYWVTLVDGGFSSSDDVESWCARTYYELDATELANACAPRTLGPPHD